MGRHINKKNLGKSFQLFKSKIINVPVDYYNEKEIAKNGSKITGVLKHKTDTKVEN